jgi:hypothetical protein
MKKLFVLCSIFLSIPTLLVAQIRTRPQSTIVPRYITFSLAGMDRPTPASPGRFTYVYVVFPPPLGAKAVESIPLGVYSPPTTASQVTNKEFSTSGDVGISLVTDLTGADESDSLAMWIKPLFWDQTKGSWYPSMNDSTFLVWGTVGTYTSTTKTYFNWADGGAYTLTLSGELWPFAGFVIGIESCMDAQVASILNGKLGVWIVE